MNKGKRLMKTKRTLKQTIKPDESFLHFRYGEANGRADIVTCFSINRGTNGNTQYGVKGEKRLHDLPYILWDKRFKEEDCRRIKVNLNGDVPLHYLFNRIIMSFTDKYYKDEENIPYRFYSYPQWFPNTAGPFCEQGQIVGHAFTQYQINVFYHLQFDPKEPRSKVVFFADKRLWKIADMTLAEFTKYILTSMTKNSSVMVNVG